MRRQKIGILLAIDRVQKVTGSGLRVCDVFSALILTVDNSATEIDKCSVHRQIRRKAILGCGMNHCSSFIYFIDIAFGKRRFIVIKLNYSIVTEENTGINNSLLVGIKTTYFTNITTCVAHTLHVYG